MASSSTSSSGLTHHGYEVFVSFRGEDTRHSFTDHLYKALRQAGIRTFRDDDEIREGQELKPEIERAIIESRASVIVFSEKFANSSWCLDELWLILEQRRNVGHFVLAVFYKVDPSDVRNQRGSYSIEEKPGVQGTKWTHDNVSRWKAALKEVADLKGMVVSGYETTFIPKIVEIIYSQLGLKLHNTPTGLTGIETRAEGIISWLRHGQPDSPVLAICGMGGSGKTTLAKHIYYSNKHHFDGSCLLEDIDKQPDGLLGVQKQLLRDISGNDNITVSNCYEGAFQIEKILQLNRVLIVVDDIDDKDILSTLFGTKVLHTQSNVIITTRILNIDTWFNSISWRCNVHNVKLLNFHESLELLCFHAFGSKIPMEGFDELAVQLAQYCGGNPLAIKVLGSSLFVSADDPRTRNNMIEVWRSRINMLNSLKGDLDYKIQGVLQKSFESLPCDTHKELFLHIACFFAGEGAYTIENTLEEEWHAKSGIMTLINRCLVSVSIFGGKLVVHQLLQDMARKIVRAESKDPAKRSIVWRYDESYRLLSDGDGSKRIVSLALGMRKVEQGMTSEAFQTSSLVKMKNLQFLELRRVKLTGSYENFPKLRWFRWRECNLKSIPSGLLTRYLVALYMNNGDLEEFEPPMVLNSLKFLDLSCSCKLVSIRSLHRLPKLVILNLWSCTSLTYVCKSIGDLDNLSYLELSQCSKLWKAPLNQMFVKHLNLLDRLKAISTSPEQPSFSIPQSLSVLGLSDMLFEILPSHIDLKMLRKLYLCSCLNLKSLSCLPSTLEELYVQWCTSLETITFQSARFTLRIFQYEGCFKLCDIQGLFKLVSIAKLDEADMGHMQWIKAYQDHEVDLVGDVITKGRSFNIQMLYEYGIRSTYLQGIKDQSMVTHEYTSSSEFLSFRVPSHPNNHTIQGLNLTILYRSSGEGKNRLPVLAKISNKTKGLTWVYSPVVYCKPKVDNDVVWLSYWPIGDVLDAGDEVHVSIFLYKKVMIVQECGASLVYMDDGEVEKEEKCGRTKREEVIGGNLDEFEVTKGGYYLCRCDILKSTTPDFFKWLFGDNIHHKYNSQRWRAPRASGAGPGNQRSISTFRNPNHIKMKVELGVNFNSESETGKIENAVSSLVGVESVSADQETRRLTVVGDVDPQAVAKCVSEFEKMVQIIHFEPV